MCGIAGFVQLNAPDNARSVLARMTQVISHRGPDDEGFFSDGLAFLGHRRLAIIDVSGGHQPMPNETRSAWVIYNGEIFNHAAMRPELEAAGHRYTNFSDTETLLHAYEQYGPASVERFRGMFAYAIWDQNAKRLFGVRDRLGIKPFYYFFNGEVFVFASEIKAVLEHPAVSCRFNEATLDEYLAFGYLSGEPTMFEGVRRLLPGHRFILDASGGRLNLASERYWDVPEPTPEKHSDEEWIAETRRRLEETVEMRLMSDVPLGSFLSGGADSSAITALMQKFMGRNVKTFSVGYQEREYSELSYAAEVARHLGTDHHEVVVGAEDFFGALPRLIWHEDEPITWPSSVSLHFVSKLAAEHVKVVLTGEGSDEMFGGYERYAWTRMNLRGAAVYNAVPSGLQKVIRNQIASSNLISASVRRKLGHTFLGRDSSLESLYLDNFYCAFPASERRRLLASSGAGAYRSFLNFWNSRPSASLLSRMLYVDQKTYLAELLMKQDQMSMSVSIESRVPFLDHTFVEFSTRVPDSLKIQGRTQKHIVKEAVRSLLPEDILFRRKMGFPTPLRDWLRQPVAAPLLDPLKSTNSFVAGYLNHAEIARLLDAHRAGREDCTDRLWRLMNLEIWGETFFRDGFRGGRSKWEESAAAAFSPPSN